MLAPSPNPSIFLGHRKERGVTGLPNRPKPQSRRVRGKTSCGIPILRLHQSQKSITPWCLHVSNVMSSLYSTLDFLCVTESKRNLESAGSESQLVIHPAPGPSSKTLETAIAEAVSDIAEKSHPYSLPEQLVPVQQELDSYKAQLTDLKAKVSSLVETFETKIRNLTSEIQDLRARAQSSPSVVTSTAQEHSVRMPEPPSTPKRVRTPYRPSLPCVDVPHLLSLL